MIIISVHIPNKNFHTCTYIHSISHPLSRQTSVIELFRKCSSNFVLEIEITNSQTSYEIIKWDFHGKSSREFSGHIQQLHLATQTWISIHKKTPFDISSIYENVELIDYPMEEGSNRITAWPRRTQWKKSLL